MFRGLGLEMVKQLAARGEKIYATVRKKEVSATGIDAIAKSKVILQLLKVWTLPMITLEICWLIQP